jgi:hypothetical protein
MEKMKLQNGLYQGKYLDIRGREGFVKFDLNVEGEKVFGKYEMDILDEHSSDKITGELSGRIVEDNIELELSRGKEKLSMKYSARFASAMPYGEQALFGQVSDVQSKKLGGGVWIAWRYRNNNK